MNVRIKIDPLIALIAHSYIIMIYQTMILQKNIPVHQIQILESFSSNIFLSEMVFSSYHCIQIRSMILNDWFNKNAIFQILSCKISWRWKWYIGCSSGVFLTDITATDISYRLYQLKKFVVNWKLHEVWLFFAAVKFVWCLGNKIFGRQYLLKAERLRGTFHFLSE